MPKKLQVEYIPIEELQTYENNAKLHPAEQVEQIKKSIQLYGMNDPIAVWKDNVIIEGHGRLIALQELGFDLVPIIRLDDLTDEQRREYALIHNKTTMNSGFDFDLLDLELEWIQDNDLDFDMGEFGFELAGDDDVPDVKDLYPDFTPGILQNSFGVPPFSVLDTRQGYWQDRKRKWLEKTGDLSETRDGEYGKTSSSDTTILDYINGGTSNFDPVLAEIMYSWFCVPGGSILDPFGGEQTKGVVAGELGYRYTACEIRQNQVDLDTEKTKQYKGVRYYCGNSENISQIIKERDFDMCFTSPPYYDLEVYSRTDLSALGTYEEFMLAYKHIFEQCYEMLRDDSFLVIKVAEIRNKATGEYRSFVADNIKTMTDIGFKYYNEIALINAIGTAAIRARRMMQTRKVVKVHQNVLVFYKGDLKNIQERFPVIEFEIAEEE